MKFSSLSAVASLALCACAPASAQVFDGNDDLNCSVLGFYLMTVAKSATDNERRSAFVLSAWYNRKIGHKPDVKEAAPILEAAKADFTATKSAVDTCLDRSVADPAFEDFAREAADVWNQTNGS